MRAGAWGGQPCRTLRSELTEDDPGERWPAKTDGKLRPHEFIRWIEARAVARPRGVPRQACAGNTRTCGRRLPSWAGYPVRCVLPWPCAVSRPGWPQPGTAGEARRGGDNWRLI